MNNTNHPDHPEKEGLPSPEEELVAYLDGELDAGDRKRVEARLAEDPALRQALEQHKLIAGALASDDGEDGLAPEETLRGVYDGIRRSMWARSAKTLAAAASIIFAVFIAARLITGLSDPADQAPHLARQSPATMQEEVIADLDVLEVLHEEGGEISLDLVNLLLEDTNDTGVLDSGLFDEWLEEEISGENF